MNSKYLFCSASLNLLLIPKKNFSLHPGLVGADGRPAGALLGSACSCSLLLHPRGKAMRKDYESPYEGTEAQRGKATCPRLYSWQVAELG